MKTYTNSIDVKKKLSNFMHDLSKLPHLYVLWGHKFDIKFQDKLQIASLKFESD